MSGLQAPSVVRSLGEAEAQGLKCKATGDSLASGFPKENFQPSEVSQTSLLAQPGVAQPLAAHPSDRCGCSLLDSSRFCPGGEANLALSIWIHLFCQIWGGGSPRKPKFLMGPRRVLDSHFARYFKKCIHVKGRETEVERAGELSASGSLPQCLLRQLALSWFFMWEVGSCLLSPHDLLPVPGRASGDGALESGTHSHRRRVSSFCCC